MDVDNLVLNSSLKKFILWYLSCNYWSCKRLYDAVMDKNDFLRRYSLDNIGFLKVIDSVESKNAKLCLSFLIL